MQYVSCDPLTAVTSTGETVRACPPRLRKSPLYALSHYAPIQAIPAHKSIRAFPLAAAQPLTILLWQEALNASNSRRACPMHIGRNACSLLALPDFPEFAPEVRYGVPGTPRIPSNGGVIRCPFIFPVIRCQVIFPGVVRCQLRGVIQRRNPGGVIQCQFTFPGVVRCQLGVIRCRRNPVSVHLSGCRRNPVSVHLSGCRRNPVSVHLSGCRRNPVSVHLSGCRRN